MSLTQQSTIILCFLKAGCMIEPYFRSFNLEILKTLKHHISKSVNKSISWAYVLNTLWPGPILEVSIYPAAIFGSLKLAVRLYNSTISIPTNYVLQLLTKTNWIERWGKTLLVPLYQTLPANNNIHCMPLQWQISTILDPSCVQQRWVFKMN